MAKYRWSSIELIVLLCYPMIANSRSRQRRNRISRAERNRGRQGSGNIRVIPDPGKVPEARNRMFDDDHDPGSSPTNHPTPLSLSAYPVYDPETEGVVYQVVPTQHTDSISDITSETDSTTSATTIWSDQVPDYFISHRGQQFPASENALRWLPAGDTRRDILGHVVLKYTYGGNYFGPVKDILNSEPGVGMRRHALEIGTRGGGWVQEMATEFPHVQFRSLDIGPFAPHIPRANIVFEVYDISEGLLVESDSRDIVFVNMGLLMVKNYQELLLEAYRVLRPGGLIHLRESCLGFWDPGDHSKLARITNPIGCHFVDLVRDAMRRTGADPDACTKLQQWLSPDSDMWESTSQPRGFERIYTDVKVAWAYLHEGYPCVANVDPHMVPVISYVYETSLRDSVGLLCETGISVEEANSLVDATIQELMEPDKCTLTKMYAVYATKMRSDDP